MHWTTPGCPSGSGRGVSCNRGSGGCGMCCPVVDAAPGGGACAAGLAPAQRVVLGGACSLTELWGFCDEEGFSINEGPWQGSRWRWGEVPLVLAAQSVRDAGWLRRWRVVHVCMPWRPAACGCTTATSVQQHVLCPPQLRTSCPPLFGGPVLAMRRHAACVHTV